MGSFFNCSQAALAGRNVAMRSSAYASPCSPKTLPFFAAAPPTFAHVFSNYCEIATIGSRLQFVLREMSPLECE